MELGWNMVAELLWGVQILTSTCCVIYMLLVLYFTETAKDKGIIKTVIAYLSSFIFIYIVAILYRLNPSLFVYMAPGMLLGFTISPVLLYKIVYTITDTTGGSRFPCWHYVAPGVVTLAWIIATYFIPFDVRADITRNLGQHSGEYGWLAAYFTSMTVHVVIFQFIYLPLSFLKLSLYRKAIPQADRADSRYRLRWVEAIIIISMTSILPAIAVLFTGSRSVALGFVNVTSSFFVYITVVFTLTLNILRQNSPPRRLGLNRTIYGQVFHPMVNVVIPESETAVPGEPEPPAARYVIKLNKRELEAFFRSRKPYLDPALTLIGLAEMLGTNRVVLSGFINTAYRVNYNAYVNGWRLREIERLYKYKKYRHLPQAELAKLAGFGSYDSYRRAMAGNNAGVAPTKNDENQKSRGGTLPPMRMKKNEKKNEE